MALISVISIIAGFVLSVYAGIVLSLPSQMRDSAGGLNQSKITLFSIIMTLSVLMVLGGVIGYYVPSANVPYFMK